MHVHACACMCTQMHMHIHVCTALSSCPNLSRDCLCWLICDEPRDHLAHAKVLFILGRAVEMLPIARLPCLGCVRLLPMFFTPCALPFPCTLLPCAPPFPVPPCYSLLMLPHVLSSPCSHDVDMGLGSPACLGVCQLLTCCLAWP